MFLESEKVEFKSEETENIYKEVIAFANTEGGTIFVGIDDRGNTADIKDIDATYTKITNGIRDAILPDVTMFVHYELLENKTIKIEVASGTGKPYYLRKKGLKTSGVFVRQGASSVGASQEQIRQMIKESDGDEFEKMRSLNQKLEFGETEKTFKRYGVEFSEEKFSVLKLQDLHSKQFTNLALILSDQCPYTLKVAVFSDDANTDFKDSKEFGGSIFSQLEEAFSFLMLCNKTKSTFRGLERIDTTDFPEIAVREALINALIHRDYSYSGSIIVNVNSKAMEFISLGGLPNNLTIDDIKNGISQPRNFALAEIFHRLHLMESYGTGIRRIFATYKDCDEKPKIEVTEHTFKLSLPNVNIEKLIVDNDKSKDKEEILKNNEYFTPQIKMIIDYLEEHRTMTCEDIQNLVGVKRTRSYLLAKEMQELGLIKITGRGDNRILSLYNDC